MSFVNKRTNKTDRKRQGDGGQRKENRKALAYAIYNPEDRRAYNCVLDRKELPVLPVGYVKVALWPLGEPGVQEAMHEPATSVGQLFVEHLRQLAVVHTHDSHCSVFQTFGETPCNCYLKAVDMALDQLAFSQFEIK